MKLKFIDTKGNSYRILKDFIDGKCDQSKTLLHDMKNNDEYINHRDDGKGTTVEDYLGNIFGSVREMCEYHGVEPAVFYQRRKRGLSLESSLTIPVQNRNGSEPGVRDFTGRTFESERKMCKAYKIPLSTYRSRIQKGWDMREALLGHKERVSVDHLGNRFQSLSDMCRKWNVLPETYRARISSGMSVKDALTVSDEKCMTFMLVGNDVTKLREDFLNEPFSDENFDSSLKKMCEHFGTPYRTVISRIKQGWPVRCAVLCSDRRRQNAISPVRNGLKYRISKEDKVMSEKEKGTINKSASEFLRKHAYPCGEEGFLEPEDGKAELGNLIISKDVRLCLDTKQSRMNANVLVIGAPGTGRGRHHVKPNLLQMNSSYFVVDTEGENLRETGVMLEADGYEVKVLNLCDFSSGIRYNPFSYIHPDSVSTDIEAMVEAFMLGTGVAPDRQDPFFYEIERRLLAAVALYVYYHEKPENRTFMKLKEVLNSSDLNLVFDEFEQEYPDTEAVKKYSLFRGASKNVAKSILISANVRLSAFCLKEVAELVSEDTAELNTLGRRKQAIFVVLSATTNAYSFIASMFCVQAMREVYRNCDENLNTGYMVRYGNTSPIWTEMSDTGNASAESEDILTDFHVRWENYQSGNIVTSSKRFCIMLGDGTFSAETFRTEKQAEFFMKSIREGELVRAGECGAPSHVHFFFDDLENLYIPGLQWILATMRKVNMSASVIVPSVDQLKKIYPKEWDNLCSSCDTILYMGGFTETDQDFILEAAEKCRDGSVTRESIKLLDKKKCLIVSGNNVFRDNKYDIKEHPNYSLLGEASGEYYLSENL